MTHNHDLNMIISHLKEFDDNLNKYDITTPDELYDALELMNNIDITSLNSNLKNNEFYTLFCQFVDIVSKLLKPFDKLSTTQYWIFDDFILPNKLLKILNDQLKQNYHDLIPSIMLKYNKPEEINIVLSTDTIKPKRKRCKEH